MRLLVCGGRDFADRGAAFRALDRLQERRPIGLVIHGGAPGADALAGEWAQSRGIAVQVFEALWKSQGPSAGPLRNQRMLDIGRPDGVLALPGGRGTVDMCTRALMAGVKVWRPWG